MRIQIHLPVVRISVGTNCIKCDLVKCVFSPSLRLPALSISLSHIQSVVVLQRHRNWWFPPLQFQNRAKTGEALRIAHCFVCFSWHVQKMTTQSENNSFVTGTQICNGGREKPTFSSSIFSLRGRQSSFHWPKQVQPLLISWKGSIFVTNLTSNFDHVNVDNNHFSVFQVRNSYIFLIQLYRHWLPQALSIFLVTMMCQL